MKRIGAVLAIMVICAALGAEAAERAGEVIAMGGQCFAEAGGQRTALKVGDVVHIGDSIDVPQGAKLKLRMLDGSTLAAASGTRVTIDTFAVGGAEKRDAKFSLVTGLLRAVVTPVGQPQHFEVDTATAAAAVRSTDWFVEARPGSTQVGVLDGTVALTSAATGESVTIPARWGARVEAGRDPVPARVWSATEFDDVVARTNVP